MGKNQELIYHFRWQRVRQKLFGNIGRASEKKSLKIYSAHTDCGNKKDSA
jgi:hypothetical protein